VIAPTAETNGCMTGWNTCSHPSSVAHPGEEPDARRNQVRYELSDIWSLQCALRPVR
jgi:hypothetical protein